MQVFPHLGVQRMLTDAIVPTFEVLAEELCDKVNLYEKRAIQSEMYSSPRPFSPSRWVFAAWTCLGGGVETSYSPGAKLPINKHRIFPMPKSEIASSVCSHTSMLAFRYKSLAHSLSEQKANGFNLYIAAVSIAGYSAEMPSTYSLIAGFSITGWCS